jgi:hypothetical protein
MNRVVQEMTGSEKSSIYVDSYDFGPKVIWGRKVPGPPLNVARHQQAFIFISARHALFGEFV